MIIMDATNGRQLPELDRLHVEYEFEGRNAEGRGFGIYADADKWRVWTKEEAYFALSPAGNAPIMLDEESKVMSRIWGGGATGSELEKRRDHIVALLEVAKRAMPNNIFTSFAHGQPMYAWGKPEWAINVHREQAEKDAWMQGYGRNAEGRFEHRGIMDCLNAVTAVLYIKPAGNDFELWKRYADANVKFVRRWQRDVYGALHPDSQSLDMWKRQLDYSLAMCDRTIIWHWGKYGPPNSAHQMPDEYRDAVMERVN